MEDTIITDKQVEKILQRLNVTAEQANDGIAIVDLRGTVRFVNSFWATMHGCNTTDEMVGKHISTFHTKEQMEAADITPLVEEAKHKTQLAGLVEHVRSDGVAFGTQTKIFAIRNKQGNVVGLAILSKDTIQKNVSQHHFNDHNIEPITTGELPKIDGLEEYRDQAQERFKDEKIKPVAIHNQLHQQIAEHEQAEQYLDQQTKNTIGDIKTEYEDQLANVKAEAEQQAVKTKAKFEQTLAEARSQAEEKERFNKDAIAKAEEMAKSSAETAARAEEKLKAETSELIIANKQLQDQITEQVRTENELRHCNNKLRQQIEEHEQAEQYLDQQTKNTIGDIKAEYEDQFANVKAEAERAVTKQTAKAEEAEQQAAEARAEFEQVLAETRSQAEEKERLNKDAIAKAEEWAKSCADTAARAEEIFKAEIEEKLKVEEYAKIANLAKDKAEKKVKSYADEVAELQKKLKAEAKKRLKVEDKLKAKLAARAKRVATARDKAEAQIVACTEKSEQTRAEAEEEIASQKALLKAQTAKIAEFEQVHAETRSQAEEKERFNKDAISKAEEMAKSCAETAARAEEKLKAEIEAKLKVEEYAKIANLAKDKAEKKVKSYADEVAELQKKFKAEVEKRLKVKDKLKAKLAARAKRVATARAKAEAKIAAYTEKSEQIRADAEEEIASQKALLKVQTAKIADLKAELEAKTKTFAGDIEKARAEAGLQAKALEKIEAYTLQIDKLGAVNEKYQTEIIRQTQAKDARENFEQEIAKYQQIEQHLAQKADKLVVNDRQLQQQTSAEHVYVQQRNVGQHLSEMAVEEKLYKTSLRDLYYVFFRHKWKMALFFFTVTIIVTAGTFLCAKVYQSEAKLLVRLGRESVTLDPTAAIGHIVQISQSRENEINSELEILKSRELIEKVVDSIGAEELVKRPEAKLSVHDADSEILGKARWIFSNTVRTFHNLLKRFDIVEPMSDHNKAILEVMKNLKIENPKNNNIINISYEAKNPKLAQRVVTSFIDLYLEKHIAAHQTPGSHQFFIQQSNHLREKLVQAENELWNLKNATGISSVEKQKDILLNRIGALRQEIDSTEAALASSTAKVKSLQETLNDAPETMKELVTEEASVSSLQAQIEVKSNKFPNAQADLRALNDAEVKIKSLERELNIQEGNYRKYAENLEQARIDHAMEIEKISNISIVQSATFPLQPIRPRTLFNLLLGLSLGIFVAIGLAFFSEYLDHSIKTPEEAEEKLQLPTLAYIPHMGGVRTKRISQTVRQKAANKTRDKIVRKTSEQWIVPEKIREHYEVLRERLLLFSNGSKGHPYVLAVIGCHRGEGISTVATNLAATLSQNGDGQVLIMDTNICHPSVHKIFKTNLSPGLTDVLKNGQSNGDAIQSLPAQNLQILSAGTKNGSNSDILNSDRFKKMLTSIKNNYSFVVIDVPALNDTVSAMQLASLCDGVVLVVEAEQLRWEVAQRTREQLVKSNVNILGVVLNKRRLHVPGWLYRTL